MIKAIQYLILFVLIGNGLQPYLQERGWIQGPIIIDITSEGDCTEESDDQNQDNQSTKDFVESNDSKLIEPKPNDFEISNGFGAETSVVTQTNLAPLAVDWVINQELEHSNISASLKQHVHFSKRTIDDQA